MIDRQPLLCEEVFCFASAVVSNISRFPMERMAPLIMLKKNTQTRGSFVFTIVALLALGSLLFGVGAAAAKENKPKEIRIDYAYYNPSSLVIKKFGWLEEEFAKDGIKVRYILSLGSNRALEYLTTEGIDFGSTAGAAALIARTNGSPIKAVYIYSKPEWTATVVRKDSPIKQLKDLKGKTIAATKGTDPFIFLLRALHTVGLSKDDVKIVHLQHPDGRVALERGDVDAWAGLDPHMAQSELEGGSRLIYRNIDFNTYGFLNVREEFAREYPEYVKRVLKVYERARKWILANPDDAVKVLSEEANISIPVARKELIDRTDFGSPTPGAEHIEALKLAAPILVDEELVRKGANVTKAIAELIEPAFAKAVVTK